MHLPIQHFTVSTIIQKREDFYRHNQFTKFKKERKEIETERGFALKNLQKLQEEIANLDRQIDAKSKSMDEVFISFSISSNFTFDD